VRRVAILDAYPHVFAGAQRAALALAGGLADRGWQAEFVLPAHGVFERHIRSAGLECTVIELAAPLRAYGGATTARPRAALRALGSLPAAWQRLARHLRGRVDVLHVNDHRGLALGGPAGRLARLPVVWHVHAIVQQPALTVLGGALASIVVVPSGCVLAELRGGRVLRRTAVVPNAVPDRAWSAPPYAPSSPPTIVSLARLHPDKGLDVLVRAVVRVRSSHPDVRVRVYGTPQTGFESYASELSTLARELGVADAVDVCAPVDDPGAALAAATVYVQPSRARTEIQPLAVLEAMAQRVPVVASSVGALPEMLRDGTSGLLVPPDDPYALAVALTRVLDDADLAERLGGAAKDDVSGYTLDRHVATIEAIYDRLLPARARR
jgi:glycosyltransferase involved in cell wall biosynthesis